MTTTPNFPDFRALAQELLDAYVWCVKKYIHSIPEKDELVLHARAALATPPPEPPDTGNAAKMVAELRETAATLDFYRYHNSARIMRTAADFIERLATPPPEPPADGEVPMLVARLKAIRNDYGVQHSADCQRAAELLERTATPPPEPPTVMEIIELSDEIEEAGLGQIDLVRAALERWGQ